MKRCMAVEQHWQTKDEMSMFAFSYAIFAAEFKDKRSDVEYHSQLYAFSVDCL